VWLRSWASLSGPEDIAVWRGTELQAELIQPLRERREPEQPIEAAARDARRYSADQDRSSGVARAGLDVGRDHARVVVAVRVVEILALLDDVLPDSPIDAT